MLPLFPLREFVGTAKSKWTLRNQWWIFLREFFYITMCTLLSEINISPKNVDPSQSFWYRPCYWHIEILEIEVRTLLPFISVSTLNLCKTKQKQFDLHFRSCVIYFRSFIFHRFLFLHHFHLMIKKYILITMIFEKLFSFFLSQKWYQNEPLGCVVLGDPNRYFMQHLNTCCLLWIMLQRILAYWIR